MRINPWKIDLVRELEELLQMFQKENLNFVIAGYAADNAAFIYKRKIDTIEKIAKPSKVSRIGRLDQEEILLRLPDIKVETVVGKTYIDLSHILDRLEEIIENRLRLAPVPEEAPDIAEYYSDTRLIEEKAKEIGELIKNAYKVFKKSILLSDIIKTLDNYSPYLVIFAILFLYVEGVIDVDFIEEDGVAKDIVIIPVE